MDAHELEAFKEDAERKQAKYARERRKASDAVLEHNRRRFGEGSVK